MESLGRRVTPRLYGPSSHREGAVLTHHRSEAPQPFQYQGSKRAFARRIVEAIPDSSRTLVEPFAGSAAVTLAAAFYGKADKFILNDSNAPLMDLWSSIIDDPESLVERYAELWHEQQVGDPRAYYDIVRSRFNSSTSPDPADMLYLLSRAVKGAVRYNAAGEFNQSPDNRRLGTRPATLRRRFREISTLLRGRSTVSSRDYEDLLAGVGDSAIVYMDPPYEGVSGQRDTRYSSGLDRDRFVSQLERLNARGIPFILSYDGRTGSKTYGAPLPARLNLTRIEVNVGRSASATLLGRTDETIEALYLSPGVIEGEYGAADSSVQLELVGVGSGDAAIEEGADQERPPI